MLLNATPDAPRPIAVIPAGSDDVIRREAMILTDRLRRFGFHVDLGFSGNMGKRMKRADKLNARAAVIFGEDERLARVVTIRDLDTGEQFSVSLQAMEHKLSDIVNGSSAKG